MSTSSRNPLATLPLSNFVPSLLPPNSPIKYKKRSAPVSPSTRAETSRKVSRTESNAASGSSGRRGSADITPKVKARLDEDDLGVGKSPARRLFVGTDVVVRSGVSGITSPPSPRRQQLAQSPPISPHLRRAATNPALSLIEPGENGIVRTIHDPGFPIHTDVSSTGTRTAPESTRQNSLPIPILTTSSTSTMDDFFPPSTPSSTSSRYDDQENIPPTTLTTPSSTNSKRSSTRIFPQDVYSSGSSASIGSSAYEEEDTLLADPKINHIGLGRARNGKSKLVQVTLRVVSNPLDLENEEGEELTPGRKAKDTRGKEKLAREADEA